MPHSAGGSLIWELKAKSRRTTEGRDNGLFFFISTCERKRKRVPSDRITDSLSFRALFVAVVLGDV
jgi:hypothetical protein